LDAKGSSRIAFLSDYCSINGTGENRIIFPGVDIEEGAVVIDSIILPFVKIGPGARIINAIIDESTEAEERPIAGPACRIGTEEKFMKNNDFPGSLGESITLIGRNNYIPGGAFIGSACYVADGTAENYFSHRNRLEDGESVITADSPEEKNS
jgi:ADP-glucose pyrophosphorylase